jgi:two-component system, OmpR family, response regulator CpxR
MPDQDRERVLLIDDDVDLCNLLEQYLEREGLTVEMVHNGRDAVDRLLSKDHDIAILDVMLPSLSGLEILRKVRTQSQIPVIMVTARGDETERIIGLEVGADDYLPKPFNPRELVARLRAVLRRAHAPDFPVSLPPRSMVVGGVELNPGARSVWKEGNPVALTTAEFDLLQVLMRNAGTVVTREDLAVIALGRQIAPFERSVDLHISHLRRKLGPFPDRSERIKAVRGIGYLYANPA